LGGGDRVVLRVIAKRKIFLIPYIFAEK